jgi:hypothetical protein
MFQRKLLSQSSETKVKILSNRCYISIKGQSYIPEDIPMDDPEMSEHSEPLGLRTLSVVRNSK